MAINLLYLYVAPIDQLATVKRSVLDHVDTGCAVRLWATSWR